MCGKVVWKCVAASILGIQRLLKEVRDMLMKISP